MPDDEPQATVPSIEQDHVLLDDTSASAYPLAPKAENVIRAFRVDITGPVSALEGNVTIIAHEVNFQGPNALIDTSGKAGVNQWQAGQELLKPASPGAAGIGGAAGADGTSAGNIVIYATKIMGTVRVRARGGAGARGQDGGDGSDAAAYSPGQQSGGPDCPVDDPCTIGVGPTGPPGGQGGQAGAPGKAADGGNLDIWLPVGSSPPPIVADLAGGAAPPAATPGQPGNGGAGGIYTRMETYWTVSLGQGPHHFGGGRVYHTRQKLGAQGPRGPKGPQATAQPLTPTAGKAGLVNGKPVLAAVAAPPHLLVDQDFAAQCSMQQLWVIEQIAESAYLNYSPTPGKPGNDLTLTVCRLKWVAGMAALKGVAQEAANHV